MIVLLLTRPSAQDLFEEQLDVHPEWASAMGYAPFVGRKPQQQL